MAVAADPASRVVFVALAAAISAAYTVLLPFAFTQRLSLANWQFLTGRLLAFAGALGIGMALVLTVQIYAVRRAAAARRAGGSALSGLALAVSLLPTFLCCTPVIPTMLATAGLSAVSVYSTTGTLQRFFGAHQSAFLVASLALLALTSLWGLRRVAAASCLDGTGCATDSPHSEGI
ncbi:MAG: hypothetical protein NVSMB13_01740 [Mycobacteriales bacterium]